MKFEIDASENLLEFILACSANYRRVPIKLAEYYLVLSHVDYEFALRHEIILFCVARTVDEKLLKGLGLLCLRRLLVVSVVSPIGRPHSSSPSSYMLSFVREGGVYISFQHVFSNSCWRREQRGRPFRSQLKSCRAHDK